MLELGSAKKNKVNLSDYDSAQDIRHRMLVADLSFFEHDVLQEIFFSPLKISIKKLGRNLDCDDELELIRILNKLAETGLLTINEDQVLVDKEMRKYFEFHMKRFEPDFEPDMEYLQGILRKVPIHLLTSWYAIPRTSNNIFESIVEKYLLTPQIFQRYLGDLSFQNPMIPRIIQDVFKAPGCKIASSDLITKYNLSREEFEEIILLLEFNFVCCLTYTKGEDLWLEWVTPFHEWHEYLHFYKTTQAVSITDGKIERRRKSDFAFVEDLTVLLELIKSHPVEIKGASQSIAKFLSGQVEELKEIEEAYTERLVQKLLLVLLAEEKNGKLHISEAGLDFLNMSLENKALYLYRHPYNKILIPGLSLDIPIEKNVREAEKSIRRVLKQQWVYFDEFLKGSTICLSDDSSVFLKKVGKNWKYALPLYTDQEKSLLKATILEWLFETGMTSPGICENQDCFTLTPFGRFFFDE